MRTPILPAAVIAVALLTCTVVTAQAAQLMVDPNASGDVAVRDIVLPLAPQSITQSIDPYTIVLGTSVACSDGVYTTENAWLRLFDLDDDHGLVGAFTVSSVDWGMERVTGSLDIVVNVYCLDDGMPFLYSFMNLVDSAATPVADEVLTFQNTPVGGACDSATQAIAVELSGGDCEILGTCTEYWIGMNDLGQTAPTYIASASCGLPDPTDLTMGGPPCCHLVMVVNGQGEIPDVPATTSVGAVLLLLVLLGSGAYFMRRRASL
jgi:hypothetical protein